MKNEHLKVECSDCVFPGVVDHVNFYITNMSDKRIALAMIKMVGEDAKYCTLESYVKFIDAGRKEKITFRVELPENWEKETLDADLAIALENEAVREVN